LYAGPQGSPGLDQINVALDRALAGRGMVDVSVVVDGRAGNVTRLLMR
jgi:dihydroxyacid dehydratase/phosphogluconate dehydratase